MLASSTGCSMGCNSKCSCAGWLLDEEGKAWLAQRAQHERALRSTPTPAAVWDATASGLYRLAA